AGSGWVWARGLLTGFYQHINPIYPLKFTPIAGTAFFFPLHTPRPENPMQRRQLLQLAALSAAPASLLMSRSAIAQATDVIRFGAPVPMSGAFAANGKFADLGAKLAIE